MTNSLRITLAQLNLTVGDIAGNLEKHIAAAEKARDEQKADLIVFPELGLTGYPPEDLLLRPDFLKAANNALEQFIQRVKNIYCVVSHPHANAQGLYNSCSIVFNGKVLGHYYKQHLPNYGVFDEDRYFIPGNASCVINIKDIPVGLVICEDLWFPGPVQQAASLGAKIIVSPNASPFEIDKHEMRLAVLANQARETKTHIVYVNCVGGQDEIIFDGGSMVVDTQGQMTHFAGFFQEKLLLADIQINEKVSEPAIKLPSQIEKIYDALVLSVRDYLRKNNFKNALIGVSGGIDSALTLAIAADAIGKENVLGIIMPSRHTSQLSMEEAEKVTKLCGVESQIISIEPLYEAAMASLAPVFKNTKPDLTEENLQARCRGIILMALSNKFGAIVLTTGNRSELAVGYCTLYGDMAGGFCVLKDIPKTLVFELARYRNTLGEVIPERTITRAPTAELAPNQKDEDSLPPYSVLDKILYLYLNQEESADQIIEKGFDRDVVLKVINLVRKSEYKRRQSPPGPRINNKSFGKDWRYPITNAMSSRKT